MKSKKHPGVERLPDGRYRVRGYAIDPKTGKPREIDRIIEAESASAAAKRKAELVEEAINGSRPTHRPRVADFAESWLRTKLPNLKPSTRQTYADALDSHIIPALGLFYVDAVEHDDLIKWRDSQEGAPATVNIRLRVLKTLMRDAVTQLRLERDPTIKVSALRETVDEEDEGASLTAEELARVLAAIKTKDAQWYPLVLLLAFTGLRFGEATALKWTDIDEAAGAIKVRRAQWRQRIGAPKTNAGRRTVVLTDELKDALEGVRRRSIARQVRGVDTGYVFLSNRGTLLYTSVLQKPVRRALAAAGIERPFSAAHGFRHTFNNLVRKVATGEVVRSMTGHVDEEMTEHYSHVALDEKRAAVAKVIALLRPNRGSNRGSKGKQSTPKKTKAK